MFSNKTLLEVVKILDGLKHSEIDRIIYFFNFSSYPLSEKATVGYKANKILTDLRYGKKNGPYSDNAQIDLLQYLIDDFFDKNSYSERHTTYNSGTIVTFKNAFSHHNKELANTLKRDGYIIEGNMIKKLLPLEIEEAKTESELIAAIDRFKFQVSKGHLTQAITNHTQGNWSSANSQFRTFIESLLIEISNFILPENMPTTASQAIKILGETANPPFLSKALNEYPHDKDSDSFINGLWIRLHSDGSHPGLSDEEDSSFRYHITIVFANYLLRRLAQRKSAS